MLPEGLTSIGENAFAGCALKTVSIPDSLTHMGANPFKQRKNLTTIAVSPEHPVFATIDGVLFNKTEKKLICYPAAMPGTEYAVPRGIRLIGDGAFYWCEALEAVTIPDTVTEIGAYGFYRCGGLASMVVPDSVTAIGDYAFAQCCKMNEIYISNSITAISERLFENCFNQKLQPLAQVRFQSVSGWRA